MFYLMILELDYSIGQAQHERGLIGYRYRGFDLKPYSGVASWLVLEILTRFSFLFFSCQSVQTIVDNKESAKAPNNKLSDFSALLEHNLKPPSLN